jgi:4-diphosphocytidyl-2-C-methyl-D-erythritol kinase
MVAVELFDTLVLRDAPDGQVALTCTDSAVPAGPENLVVRAARLIQERIGSPRGCSIRLVKRIPMAAGLAGGSSDAAATLLGLNRLWRLERTPHELAAWAAELGSDVAFFLHGPAAWCTGRGEIVTAAPMRTPLDLVLICPSFGMPTAEVYRGVKVPERPQSGEAIRAALASGDGAEMGRRLFNRLSEPAARLDARMTEYYKRLAALAPLGQLMSGSGSSLFALAGSPADAQRIAAAMRQAAAGAYQVYTVRSCA